MKKLRQILALICLTCALAVFGAQAWEHVSAYKPVYEAEDTDKVEVTVAEGYIYVTTSKPVTVKVMSIVGQLISQQNIPAGTSRFKVNARGIYILKAGQVTTRVTV